MHESMRRPLARRACAFLVILPLVLAAWSLLGCGGKGEKTDPSAEVAGAATSFLDALGDLRLGELRGMMSSEYLSANQVPDPITEKQLVAAFGYLKSYRFLPDQDVTVEGDRAAVTVTLELTGKGESMHTLALRREEGAWKVDAFTAMDWSKRPPGEKEDPAAVEQALRDFLNACLDGRTEYVFQHLSREYREKHRLEKPWTAAEFSGIFGTARSYDFDPRELVLAGNSAEVDVSIEFGSVGNLETQTSRVRLVKEGKDWLVDVFPFFIY